MKLHITIQFSMQNAILMPAHINHRFPISCIVRHSRETLRTVFLQFNNQLVLNPSPPKVCLEVEERVDLEQIAHALAKAIGWA
jgi:hypothetical protein